MIRAAAVALGAFGVSGCLAIGGPGTQKVVVDGDTFFVRIDGTTADVHNFATGASNQARLFANAQVAVARVSACTVTDFRQEMGVNTYTGRIAC